MKSIALLLVLIALASPALAQDTITVPYLSDQGIDYGVGFSSRTNSRLAPCVRGQEPSEASMGGQVVDSKLSLIDEASDFRDQLNLNVSETVKGGIFSESYDVQFMNDLKVARHSINYVLASSVKGNSSWILRSYDLLPEMKKLYKENRAAFVNKCGDYFVLGFATGGRYFGTVTIDTTSTEEHNHIKAAFQEKLNSVIAKGSASASVENDWASAVNSNRVTIRQFTSAGSGITIATDAPTLLSSFTNFASKVASQPSRHKVILQSYALLPDVDGDSTDLTELENLFGGLGAAKIDLRAVLNDIDHIARRPSEFPTFRSGSLDGLRSQVQGDINEIDQVARTCFDRRDVCRSEIVKMSGRATGYRAQLPPQGGLWVRMAGSARQVSVANRDLMWAISQKGFGCCDYVPQRWDSASRSWIDVGGGLVNLSVAPDGTVYGVNSSTATYVWTGTTWSGIQGGVTKVAAGGRNWLWGLNGNGMVFKYNNATNHWDPWTPGGGRNSLSAPSDQTVFATLGGSATGIGDIWWLPVVSGWWYQWSGQMSQIAAGSRANVWGLDGTGRPHRWDDNINGWVRVPGPLDGSTAFTSISVGADGTAVGVTGQGEIWTYMR